MTDVQGMAGRIALMRKRQGLTQEQLGQLMGVSGQAVSKWENGDSLPDLPLIPQLADTFGCTTDYLFGRSGGLQALIPQIRESFGGMTTEEKIAFLGEMISAAEVPIPTPPLSELNPGLPHIFMGPTGIGLWAKDRLASIMTAPFLQDAIELAKDDPAFPLTILPEEVRQVLFSLLREDVGDLQPDYAVEDKVLRAQLPADLPFERVMDECIELGFVDRVRGGWRLNFKGDLTVRLLTIVHRVVSRYGTLNVTVARPADVE